jgi:hypothetical protein
MNTFGLFMHAVCLGFPAPEDPFLKLRQRVSTVKRRKTVTPGDFRVGVMNRGVPHCMPS